MKLLSKVKISDKMIILADQGIMSGVNFINAILIAKFLGVHAFGVYAMCLLAVQFLASIQQAYIIKPLYSLYPEESKSNKNFLSGVNSVQGIFTIVAGIFFFGTICFMSLFFEEFQSMQVILMLTLYASAVTFYDYLRRLLILAGKTVALLISDAVVYGSFFFSTVLMHQLDMLSVINILIINSIFLIGTTMVLMFVLKLSWSNVETLKVTGRKLWIYSKFLVFTSVLQWFSGNLFILFAGVLLGPVALGVVRIAQSIMGVFNVLFLAMENIIPLKAAYIKSDNEKNLIPYFKKTFIVFAIPVVLMVLVLSLFDNQIISFFGEELNRYGFVIMAFALLYLLVYVNTMQQFFIRTIKSNDIIFKSYVVASIFGIIFSKPIITHWGIIGVLVGLFVTQALVNITNYALIKRAIR